MSREGRAKLYEHVSSALLAQYEQARSIGFDSGLTGAHGEGVLREWLGQWLPTRFEPLEGAVLSSKSEATNQMDCMLVDRQESPLFYKSAGLAIVPIEGVTAAIEINTGEGAKHDKIIKDAEKLSKVAQLARELTFRSPIPMSHTPAGKDPFRVTTEDLNAGLTFHHRHNPKPLLLIFAEELDGSLSTVAERLAEHNLRVGVDHSVDGLFILRSGLVLHANENKQGWVVQRMAGTPLAYLKEDPAHVLLKFQSVILRYLYLMKGTYPGGFDEYIFSEGQGPNEIARAVVVAADDYITQADSRTRVS
jgi:hypothetical protein